MSVEIDKVSALELQLLPSWAREDANANKYSNYAGSTDRAVGGRDDRRRGDRPGGFRPNRPPRDDHRGPRPARPDQGAGDARRPAFRGARDGRGERGQGPQGRGRPQPFRPAPVEEPLLPLRVEFLPDELGVESIAREIKLLGRAYPIFQIAQLILQRPQRHSVVLSVVNDAQGIPQQRLFQCACDQSLWLSKQEAQRHAFEAAFDQYYEAQRTEVEGPKGEFSFVAQCGFSGVILGPPNYHGYQNQLARLHAERFARVPFEEFKSRVRIVREPEVVQKWLESLKWKTLIAVRNAPEPTVLATREEAAAHFQTHFAESAVKELTRVTLPGSAASALRSPRGLAHLLRHVWEQECRFPIQMATCLSKQFASLGLQFFKRDKVVTFVSVARPRYFDMDAALVSDRIRMLVDFINATSECTRRKILDSLAPAPSVPAQPPAAPQPDAAAPAAALSPEATQLVADLHWLVHEGYVIEFANGVVETAKRPKDKAARPAGPAAQLPEKQDAEDPAAPAESET